MKDKVLLGLAGIGVGLIGFLVLYSPPEKNSLILSKDNISSETKEYSAPSIVFSSSNNEDKAKVSVMKRDLSRKREVDPHIRSFAFDRYKTYMLQVVDPNAVDKPKVLKFGNFYPLEGKIDNKPFYLKIPKEIVEKEEVILRIVNLRTGEKFEIKPTFLQDLTNIEDGGRLVVELSTKDPNNFNVDIKYPDPEVKTALPPL